jgi:acylphosphatase
MSLLRRQHSVCLSSNPKNVPHTDVTIAFQATYKHISRLINWLNQIIPATIEELESKERRMFENMATLTSSADFIKAVRDSDLETAKKVLAINVRPEIVVH